MLRALVYLRLASLRNRLVAAAARLRQPKYFAGAVVGAAYVYFFVIRPLTSSWRAVQPGGGAPPFPGHFLFVPTQPFSDTLRSVGAAVVF